ncbi:MAG: ABC transporter permease, partial [Mollicutes bacterium]|nr:ABC transporter permease [Mollicutes bacterium]
KKLLLLGFFLSGMFILFALSNLFGITNIDDSKFVKVNKDYLSIARSNFKVKDYLEYENLPGIDYIMPGDSLVSFTVRHDKYLQTINALESFSGSMTDVNLLKNEDLIYGRMPNNEKEIVIDQLVFANAFNSYIYKHVGLTNEKDYLNYKFNIPILGDYILVGVSNTNSPNIYVHKSEMINILQNHQSYSFFDMMPYRPSEPEKPIMPETGIYDYQLFKDDLALKRGKYPEKPYEVIVSYNDRFIYPLNKKIETKINNTKLIVVGYYETKSNINHKLVNEETIKYSLISAANQITIMPKDKDLALSELRNKNLNVDETYLSAKREYTRLRSSMVTSSVTVSIVILAISFIEIFLIIRSSFLSRIKEVGTLRAIGMKKGDIYKMFLGEIIAITSIASLLGIAFMSFTLDRLTSVQFFKDQFMINPKIILLSIILVYTFNFLGGLFPVYNTIKKTPASILSRPDVD